MCQCRTPGKLSDLNEILRRNPRRRRQVATCWKKISASRFPRAPGSNEKGAGDFISSHLEPPVPSDAVTDTNRPWSVGRFVVGFGAVSASVRQDRCIVRGKPHGGINRAPLRCRCPYEKYPRFHAVMAEDSGQSVLSTSHSTARTCPRCGSGRGRTSAALRGGYPRSGEERTPAMRALASSWICRRWSAPRKLSAYSL